MMRVKRVNRYYCDHCGKGGGSKWHLQKHENHCTMNPDRACGLCEAANLITVPHVPVLVKMLPKVEEYEVENTDEFGPNWHSLEITDAINAALPALREAVDNCPACIMAAIRQAKIPVPTATDFDYKIEINAFWAELNQEQRHAETA